MTARSMSARADSMMLILSKVEMILKKGSFSLVDLLISSLSMMLLAVLFVVYPCAGSH